MSKAEGRRQKGKAEGRRGRKKEEVRRKNCMAIVFDTLLPFLLPQTIFTTPVDGAGLILCHQRIFTTLYFWLTNSRACHQLRRLTKWVLYVPGRWRSLCQ
ncbi:MAG: hypothetical protein F6K25_04925 [Okeania sp. SIO2G4]|uniref:hypothetical protein n=1 Tax=unclassified Okeania TaxID=2634635 RepID=UPI0013C089F8|nr:MULTISPECIES: hypothetical protein [unclassified Okeania]NEP71389.1 hypothetical protein [Okeania sp. SIO2G5]NEQ90105.1 hypothetical protein [Okeania sp. SIO2G4]